MKNTFLKLAVVALLTGLFNTNASAQVVVNLGALDINSAFNTSAGLSGAVSAPLGSATVTHTFTVSDLDVAEDGSANDSVVFSYDVTATNGNVELVNDTAFAYGVDGVDDPGDNEIDLDEGLSFSNLNATVTFGDPVPEIVLTISAEFNSFFTRFPGGGDVVNLTDENGNAISITSDIDGGADDLYAFEFPQTAFSVVSGGGNGFGVDTINATFTFTFGASGIPCDVNQDGMVDFLDIAPFIAVLSSGGFQAEADCNGDTMVDFADIAPFIAALSGA